MTLKILSWNIWISGHFDQISDFLKKSNADIIGLQEVKDNDSKIDVIKFLTDLGYKYVYASIEKTWGGNIYTDGPAIFSKYEIIKSEIYSLSKIDNRAAIRADIQVNGKVLHVFNTHLIHTHQKESEAQTEQVLNILKVLPTDNAIVMGDFNATPESQTIKEMKKVLIDSDPSSMSTWSVYPEGCEICNPQEINIRLDYIFTTKDIKVSSFEIGSSKGSDHLPILATVEV